MRKPQKTAARIILNVFMAIYLAKTISVSAAEQNSYADVVTFDEPVTWWRLDETSGDTAANSGTIGQDGDGTLTKFTAPGCYVEGLLSGSSNGAMLFDGLDDQIAIPNHTLINQGTFTAKSIESWFKPLAFSTNDNQRVIYEQGGGAAGFNHYIRRETNDYTFICGAWGNGNKIFSDPINVSTGEIYHAISVYDGSNATLQLYFNGVCVSKLTKNVVTNIPPHTNPSGIGFKNGATLFNSDFNATNSFAGVIDEVATYNRVMPYDRIQAHYIAGSGHNMGLRDGVTLGARLNYDAALDINSDQYIVDSIGTLMGNRESGQFNWVLTDITLENVNSRIAGITNAWRFNGTTSTKAYCESFARILPLNSSIDNASMEIVFKPSDFEGDELLVETGGSTTGCSLSLNGSLLRLYTTYNNGTATASTTFDLMELSRWQQSDFIHAIGVVDIETDRIYLYVNGVLRSEAVAEGDLLSWSGNNQASLGGQYDGNIATPVKLSNLSGHIALMRFYDKTLTPEEVNANYQSLNPPEILPGTIIMVK